jgi:predicted lipid-binding transport protein (Tim44 family)
LIYKRNIGFYATVGIASGGIMKLWSLLLAATLLAVSVQADAKRMGGGKSFGKQSSNVTQNQAVPNTPAAPNAAPNAAATKPAVAPAAAAPKRPWGAMLGGLAAGLGLAWLASSLGLGAEFGQFLMFAMLALVIMVAVGWFMRRRAASNNGQGMSPGQARSPLAFQGAGGDVANPASAKSYRPESVGNDASARPWERTSMAFDASKNGSSMIGSALGPAPSLNGSQSWGVPAEFDTNGFLNSAKQNFITLQAAWDSSDINSLRSMMTDAMLGEIKAQLAEREQHTGAGANHTEVASLDAKLLGIEEDDHAWLASVEFSGMIKEDPSQSPGPFREVWNMSKAKSGTGGWLVAGVQALQ